MGLGVIILMYRMATKKELPLVLWIEQPATYRPYGLIEVEDS